MIVATAVLCLTANLYYEARGEPIMGQYAVAMVTVNRAEKKEENICKEVFKPKQFSWTNKGVRRVATGWKIPDPKDSDAWNLAYRIASVTLSGRMYDFTNRSMFYHTASVRPAWRLALNRTKRIGSHQFYSLPT